MVPTLNTTTSKNDVTIHKVVHGLLNHKVNASLYVTENEYFKTQNSGKKEKTRFHHDLMQMQRSVYFPINPFPLGAQILFSSKFGFTATDPLPKTNGCSQDSPRTIIANPNHQRQTSYIIIPSPELVAGLEYRDSNNLRPLLMSWAPRVFSFLSGDGHPGSQ